MVKLDQFFLALRARGPPRERRSGLQNIFLKSYHWNYIMFTKFIIALVVLSLFLVQSSPAKDSPSTSAEIQAGPQALTSPTPRQQRWLASSPDERVRLAQALGEEGAEKFAKEMGLEPLLTSEQHAMSQGPDIVCRATDGSIVVIEAKGGGAPLGKSYGSVQGSPSNAVSSSERVLKSIAASEPERLAARQVLESAARGDLKVWVVRTAHALGEPESPVLEQSRACTSEASQMATEILGRLSPPTASAAAISVESAPQGELAGTVETTATAVEAPAIGGSASTLVKGARVLAGVGVAVDVGVRAREAYSVEQAYKKGQITETQRNQAIVKNAAECASGWAGAWAGAETLGAGGAAGGVFFGGPVGASIGGTVGGIAGGIAGYIGGEAAADRLVDWCWR